jgi:hypothetical protein
MIAVGQVLEIVVVPARVVGLVVSTRAKNVLVNDRIVSASDDPIGAHVIGAVLERRVEVRRREKGVYPAARVGVSATAGSRPACSAEVLAGEHSAVDNVARGGC